MKKIIVALCSLGALTAFGHSLGVSSFPLQTKKSLISAEFGGFLSDGKGAGLQARYTQKLTPVMSADAGFGFSNGDRTYRVFANAEYELYPDYLKQPRISLRGGIERADEFDKTRTRFNIVPTVSKGFSFWGKEAFPYVAVPVALQLENTTSTYDISTRLSVGMAGQLPIKGYEHLLGNVETSLDIDNSYSGAFVGISYPLN